MDNVDAGAAAQQFWANEDLQQNIGKEAEGAYGSAQFADHGTFKQLGLFDGPIVLGHAQQPGLIRYSGNGHLITFAPNGAGKSVASVVPNCLYYGNFYTPPARTSLVVIDPKGAIPSICWQQRIREGGIVWLFDPFHAVKAPELQQYRKSYNPFDFLTLGSPELLDDVRLISDALVIGETGGNAYFSDTAKTVLECLILYTLVSVEQEYWTLDTVLELAYSDPTAFAEKTLPEMQKSPAFGGVLAQLANQLAGLGGEAGMSVWSTLRRSLNVLQSPRMKEALRSSDVDFARLKEEKITVFLVLPATRLSRYGKWLRLMLSLMIAQNLDTRKPDLPLLFLVDEAAALGNLQMLSDGIALFRGYHLKIWTFWQSLDQLKATYPEKWETFLANSGVKQVFNCNDFGTADYFSRYMGNQTRQVLSASIQSNQMGSGSNISHIQRALLTPDEVMRLDRKDELLLIDGQFPIKARKIVYFTDPQFVYSDGTKSFGADPYL